MEKTIYYCWFGRNPLTPEILAMIETWRQVFPAYQIIEINEDNFTVADYPYAQQAYDARRFAFVSDCARVYFLHKSGGIYFDTDVEVMKDFTVFFTPETDLLLSMEYFNFEITGVSTAVMASKAQLPIWNDLLEKYRVEPFDNVPEPETINKKMNNLLEKYTQLQYNDRSIQNLQYKNTQITIVPSTVLMQNTAAAYAIHHLDGSWLDDMPLGRKIRRIVGISLKKIIGRERFERIWEKRKK